MRPLLNRLSAALPGLVFALACVCCSNQGPSAARQQALRIGYLPIAAQLPLFVALEEGYFEEEGLKVEVLQFPSSNELVNAAASDRVDIVAGAALNVVFAAGEVSAKRPRLFAINPYSDREGFITDQLLVKTTSEITDTSGLRGKRIASFPGSVVILVDLLLESHGLPRDSYEVVQMLPKDWQAALESGAIDAVVALEPSASQIVHDGVGRAILKGFYAKLLPELPLSGHWFAFDYLARAETEEQAAVIRSYRRAIDFCNAKPDLAKRSLVKYAGVRPEILPAVNLNPWELVSPETGSSVAKYIDLLYSHGSAGKRPQVQEYVLESLPGKK